MQRSKLKFILILTFSFGELLNSSVHYCFEVYQSFHSALHIINNNNNKIKTKQNNELSLATAYTFSK